MSTQPVRCRATSDSASGRTNCIGAQLARVEAEVVLEELLRVAPDYEVCGPVHYDNIMSVRSLRSVPIRLAS